ncbi:helicase HerA-like domain-containing protein [Alteriqipengyuania lutimaris]|uniref:DUF853 family protein n=1 Tax=Alteriqipengyuania lutimaris TaxID=1538146 RepID=A0A395LPB0_9SPHN|nr:helicase HerA-like domain-containing protein [Alteriqipengyuania lutimaris]MBB3034161.1 hypothetical protein [Alteriqipengyuania lutimaris]RDS78539.1 DUF853 family protein [Alteriqipengyuania lutimaris]
MSALFLGRNEAGEAQELLLSRANRHGLIAGATGTGKTVTLQGLAESFSAAGVPVFLADVKGDLAGLAVPGSSTFKHADKIEGRAKALGMDDFAYADFPVVFWDLFGKQGHPVRTTVSEMGPLLLARLLDLNETQEGVLQIVFRYADENGLLLLDFADLRSMLAFAADNTGTVSGEYGRITKASIGAIQRALLTFESEGADRFFGEPALEVDDLFRVDAKGRGFINILAADTLMRSPKLYATYLFWLLGELFETLPEVGDPDKPKLVFFFDEAHLLFDDTPKAFQDTIETVVRLIRSKGVGVFFVTQNPVDIPEEIAGQIGNRIQHALRAFTPKDARAIKAAAQTYRTNSDLDVAEAITQLKVGEALVSTLDEDGAPSVVERTLIRPAQSRLGPLSPGERAVILGASPLAGKYDHAVDRESAAEAIAQKIADAAETAQEVEEKGEAEVAKRARKSTSIWGKAISRGSKVAAGSAAGMAARKVLGKRSRANPVASGVTSAAGSIATDLAGPVVGSFVRNLVGGLMR